MTIDEFIDELAKIDWSYDFWHITAYGENLRLRCDGFLFCPVTALCYKTLGHYHRIDNYWSAGDRMSFHETGQVVDAADGENWTPEQQTLRDKLIKVLKPVVEPLDTGGRED